MNTNLRNSTLLIYHVLTTVAVYDFNLYPLDLNQKIRTSILHSDLTWTYLSCVL